METVFWSVLALFLMMVACFHLFTREKPLRDEECEHIFEPVTSESDPKQFVGQECAMCLKFNHIDKVIPGYTQRYLAEKQAQ